MRNMQAIRTASAKAIYENIIVSLFRVVDFFDKDYANFHPERLGRKIGIRFYFE